LAPIPIYGGPTRSGHPGATIPPGPRPEVEVTVEVHYSKCGEPAVVKRSRKDDRIPELRRRQLRTLMLVDDLVASTMQTLRETKQDRDTFVIFLSDNGFMWNE
jgi:Sulfatase